jgi:hypothetical protein
MQTEISVRFDEPERQAFGEVASASILGGPEWDEKGPYPRVRLVRRAAEGDRLFAVELAAMKQMLEEATAERQANVEEALQHHDQDLASAFRTWLPALSHAYVLVVEAEAVALGGDAPKVSV